MWIQIIHLYVNANGPFGCEFKMLRKNANSSGAPECEFWWFTWMWRPRRSPECGVHWNWDASPGCDVKSFTWMRSTMDHLNVRSDRSQDVNSNDSLQFRFQRLNWMRVPSVDLNENSKISLVCECQWLNLNANSNASSGCDFQWSFWMRVQMVHLNADWNSSPEW